MEDSRKRILVVTLALGASAGCREGRNLQSVIVNDAGVGGAGASAGAGGGGSGGAGGGEHGAGGQGSGGAALPEDRVHSRRRGRPEHPSQGARNTPPRLMFDGTLWRPRPSGRPPPETWTAGDEGAKG